MPTPVRLVALVLVLSGLGTFLLGLSLLPTDVSRTWLVVGAVFLSGGMVALALGFATRAITQALVHTSAPEAAAPAGAMEPPPAAEPPLATEPADGAMSRDEPGANTPSRFGVPGLVAAGGALLGAGAGLLVARKASAPDAPETEIVDPVRHEPVAAEPVASPADDFETDLFALETDQAETSPDEAPDFSALDLRLTREPAPLPPEPEVHATPANFSASDDPAGPEGLAAPPALDEPLSGHEADNLAEAVPGLIADEDLAALQDAPPLLAPLDSLEIVGAYDSGGVRFTMYSDGSVHASGQAGEKRYPSLQALRERLDSGASAV